MYSRKSMIISSTSYIGQGQNGSIDYLSPHFAFFRFQFLQYCFLVELIALQILVRKDRCINYQDFGSYMQELMMKGLST